MEKRFRGTHFPFEVKQAEVDWDGIKRYAGLPVFGPANSDQPYRRGKEGDKKTVIPLEQKPSNPGVGAGKKNRKGETKFVEQRKRAFGSHSIDNKCYFVLQWDSNALGNRVGECGGFPHTVTIMAKMFFHWPFCAVCVFS